MSGKPMDLSYQERSEDSNSITTDIAEEAALLGDGTNKEIFIKIDRLTAFQEKVLSVLGTKDQDWALRTILDVLPNTHAASVAFLKSSVAGQEVYHRISSFIKECFMKMQLTDGNLDLYRSLLAFYYSDKTTIVMLEQGKLKFYKTEFNECKKDYDNIGLLATREDKLKAAYRMYEIVSRLKTSISKHMVTQEISQIDNEAIRDQSMKETQQKHIEQSAEKSLRQAQKAIDEMRIRLFISHSSRDTQLVELLVALIRAALNLPAAQMRCTSIDGYRLPVGANTEQQLREELLSADAFVGVISAESLKSLYVAFELGARWGADRPLFPVLAPGADIGILGGPLKGINALSAGNSGQLHQLITDLSRILDIRPEEPAVYEHHN